MKEQLRMSSTKYLLAVMWSWTYKCFQTQTQTQIKFIQQKYIQVPYQVYMSFLEMQITL